MLRTIPALKLVTGPTAEPVDTFTAKAHLRETATDAGVNAIVGGLISAARELGEDETGRAWMRQTWDMKLDAFPCDGEPIEVPKPPLHSVTSITYVNSTGGSSTLAATGYRVDTTSEPGRITPAYGSFWPTARDVTGAVTVRFKAGYGTATEATVDDVPQRLKQAVLLTVGHWYENRENVVLGDAPAELPMAARALYQSLRVHQIR